MGLQLSHIHAAARRIHGYAVQTPALENNRLNDQVGAQCFLKAETLQRTGSFKFRGAFNRLVQLSAEERSHGVVAWSSGNHAQGIAAAAQLLGVRAVIVMPEDAPPIKIQRTRDYGADIVFYDRYRENREEIGLRLAKERGATLVPSYDDEHIIAGQGTAGLELIAQVGETGAPLDAVLICCGGGGLTAGMGTAFRALSPQTQIYAVEPTDFNDHARSLAAGARLGNALDARSICDALLTPIPGALTFDINRTLLSGVLTVTDDEVRAAMRFAFEALKLVVEPGGSVALAAVLASKLDVQGKRVGIVLSGGNVEPALLSDILAQP